MKNKFTFFSSFVSVVVAIVVIALTPTASQAQIQINVENDPTVLATTILGTGAEITISNATFTGGSMAAGTFTNGDFGLSEGILLTTGMATLAAGPNTHASAGYNGSMLGDADLTALAGFPTFDATILEFDFVTTGSNLVFTYVFGSEEYNEFVCSTFNDVFAFFVDGPGYDNVNMALVPGTSQYVGINTINNGELGLYGNPDLCDADNFANSAYFIDNINVMDAPLQYDGYTVPISFEMEVIPGETYHLKIAIADGADFVLDSGVFLEAESFMAFTCDVGTLAFDDFPGLEDIALSTTNLPGTIGVSAVGEGINDNLVYILTDADGTILDISTDGQFGTSEWEVGNFHFYAVSYAGEPSNLEIGNHIDDIDATICMEISTAIGAVLSEPTFDCPDLQANIGDACDDGDENTENDTVNDNCECVGTVIIIENTAVLCSDGIDNDGDGLADCDDPKCQALADNIGCLTCFGDGLSFADEVLEYTGNCANNAADDPESAIGMPNYGYSDHSSYVSLAGGYIKLAFTNNTLVNSGDSNPDLFVFEVGPAVESSFIELRPLDDATEALCIAAGLLDSDGDGYYEFGGIGGALASVDIDAFFDDLPAQSVFFDAIKITDAQTGCPGTTPGADIDAVCALSSVACVVGQACDDGNPDTYDDALNESCECVGIPYDCPDLQANIGDACDDGDENTENDTVNDACECAGTPVEIFDCPDLQANIGDACDDGDANTEDDTVNDACECAGIPVDPYDCPDLQANIGDACDDGDANTENDTVNDACECAGESIWECPDLQANNGDDCILVTGAPGIIADCNCVNIPDCAADAGNLAFADGSLEMSFCALDGVPSTIALAMTDGPTEALPFVWLATDAAGVVLEYSGDYSNIEAYDFDSWGVGTYHIYVLSYQAGESNVFALRNLFLGGAAVNIDQLEGCFDLSNYITLIGMDCEETEGCYAVEILDYNQGPQTNGNPVSADRSDPTTALYEPDRSNAPGGFFSLGVGGHITLAFDGIIYDAPGADIKVYETSYAGDDCSGPSDERADIELSPDGINFYPAGTICRDGEVDMADAGLDQVFAIRITNAATTAHVDGYDVDGVEAIHGCEFGPFTSTEDECVAVDAVDYTAGTQLNGSPLPPNRTDATQALGEPERTNSEVFVTLGYGGSIVLSFDGSIPNQPGADIEVVETTFNFSSCGAYPEYADVYVSLDGVDWHFAKTVCHDDRFVDFSDAGLFPFVNYVKIANNDALSSSSDGFDLDGVACVVIGEDGPQPLMAEVAAAELSSHPNPTTGASQVIFTTPESAKTILEVYDMNGRNVATLFNGTTVAGEEYRIDFDGNGLPNGVYIYRMTTEHEITIDKFMIAR